MMSIRTNIKNGSDTSELRFEKYEKAELKIVTFENTDVLTGSNDGDWDTDSVRESKDSL